MKRKIGIYGGKFDPIHSGHLICAEWTREEFDLDEVLFVTSADPPHKRTGNLNAACRHAMVEAAIEPNCYFKASDIELRREGPSYTYQTLQELQKEYGDETELSFLISAEYLDPDFEWRVDRWEGSDIIFDIARLLVFPRADMGLEQIKNWAKQLDGARIEYLDCPAPPVSSSMIRKRVSEFKSIWYMVTPEVWQLIRDNRYYLQEGSTPPERYYGRCLSHYQSTTNK